MWTLLEGFKHLEPAELDALLEAPVLVAVLIGAADGDFDREERTWSARLVHAFSYAGKPKQIHDLYRIVEENFEQKVYEALASYPSDAEARNGQIADKLAMINPLLAKLEPKLGAGMYKSLCTLALETAKASGGFLRLGAISAAENKWVNLPMLTPIEAPPETDTEVAEEDIDAWKDDEA